MKTKLHTLFFAVLFSLGMQAQTVSVTSTLPATIETGDMLDFSVDYTTDSNAYNLILRFYEDNAGTITRYGTDQSFKAVPANTTGTESLSIEAPLVAATNYIARIFLEGPSPDYNKVFADDIPFTVTAKAVSVKASYLFDTNDDTEGWAVGSIGAPNTSATVANGAMVINTGSGSWDVGYVEQKQFKLDPTIHTIVHITYKNLSLPNENNQIELDWITSGTSRSTRVVLPIKTSGWSDPMADFETVTYDLGANTQWIDVDNSTVADATNFRLYISRDGGGPKDKDLEIDSIVFDNGDTTLALDDNFKSSIESLSIYPNPFTDSFTYKLNSKPNAPVSIELFTITGRKINSINAASLSNTGTVNTRHLNKGVYVVRITSGNVQATRRLIKN
ncbi:T9SS type A sorting domain-containing protein [Tamlana sp. 2_MG-2023]|uniref:T9SS type A sorting domain-containing protein n=1 Tax=unclassified Tamlana TaxID=2614803 RepID=UPI0026E45FB6|nr:MULTISPECIES: T9SS type A sorting domain-containing protein [unclassified Tamlana]MDO6759992.1 T9SS type A sorting domain-containing protein [Tamlana sp. 2_MG-2023]MDO6791838.1 T9SS type A sorting domain-containing protein [Tamlana sp. 1_MG-2023]